MICLALASVAQAERRREVPLSSWQFQREGAAAWQTVRIPSTFQEYEGVQFQGVGQYRTTLPALDLPVSSRLLVHFDLSSPVVPNVDCLEMIDPVLMPWDSHDLNTIKTHGLIFETRAGKGRILVSALHHAGATNAAGRYVLATLVDHLATGPAPRNALSESAWNRLKQKLHDGNIDLTNK